MKLILALLLAFSSFEHSISQDSLYINEIDKIVSSIETRIKQSNSKLFTVNVFFYDWHEQYIIDTSSKNLLRVKRYKVSIDTLPIHHAFREPFFTIDTNIQSQFFYYNENYLIKISDEIYLDDYYVQDSNLIARTELGLETVYNSNISKMFWFYNNRFIRHYKELFGKESRFKN